MPGFLVVSEKRNDSVRFTRIPRPSTCFTVDGFLKSIESFNLSDAVVCVTFKQLREGLIKPCDSGYAEDVTEPYF